MKKPADYHPPVHTHRPAGHLVASDIYIQSVSGFVTASGLSVLAKLLGPCRSRKLWKASTGLRAAFDCGGCHLPKSANSLDDAARQRFFARLTPEQVIGDLEGPEDGSFVWLGNVAAHVSRLNGLVHVLRTGNRVLLAHLGPQGVVFAEDGDPNRLLFVSHDSSSGVCFVFHNDQPAAYPLRAGAPFTQKTLKSLVFLGQAAKPYLKITPVFGGGGIAFESLLQLAMCRFGRLGTAPPRL
jgi:hypothetical protein